MADQTQRLEIATVRAEVGSNIVFRFSNDAAAAAPIPTESGDIQNLKQVILEIQAEAAEKISISTTIYPTVAAGLSATADQEIFLVQSDDANEIYTVWKNEAGSAVNTGKTALSATAIQTALDASNEAAQAAEEAADTATSRTAGFLAPSAVPPVVRDNGLPLQQGDRYFNTEEQAEYIYKDGGWAANDSEQAIQDLIAEISEDSGPSLIPRALPNGKLAIGWIPTELTSLALRVAGIYTPQMFGVTNDGVTNYTNEIRNLHNAANAAGNVRVDYHGISVLCIDAGAFITVNTDVDWAGCKLKLLNGFDPNPDFQTSTVFFVDDPDVQSQTISVDPSELFKGATRITVPESIGNGFLLLQSNKPVGNRTSEPGVDLFFEQPFSIERGGVLNKPLGADLTTYAVTAIFRRNPSRWIDLRGLVADESTFNNQCLVKVRRNLVRQFGYVVQPSGINTQPKNVNYLFQATYCSNIVCEDWQVSAQTSDGGITSTYGITADRVAELFYNRITGKGRNTWGVTLTDFVNGWYINDCHLNRIDVHKGMHNTYVRGGSLYDLGVRYGWGTGTLLVEGVTVYGNTPVVAARTDYDGGWDGEIQIIDPVLKYGKLVAGASGVAEVNPVFSCSALGGRAPVKMCESLEIINPTFDYEGESGILLVRPIVSDVVSGNTGVQLPSNIVVENVKCNKGKVVFSFGFPMEKYTAPSGGKCMVDISRVNARPLPAFTTLHRTSPVSSYISPSGTFEINMSHITGLMTYFGAPGAKINIDQSEISGIKSFVGTGPSQAITITDSDMVDTLASLGGSTVGELSDASSDVIVSRMTVKSQANLSFADALQGVLIKNGVTCTLPGSATAATAFTGYKSSTVYQ